MMIPFKNNGHLTQEQRNFNRRLSQARVRVENAFGRAKEKWRRLKFIHVRNQAHLIDHVTASFVLHNFLILNGEALEVSTMKLLYSVLSPVTSPCNVVVGRRTYETTSSK